LRLSHLSNNQGQVLLRSPFRAAVAAIALFAVTVAAAPADEAARQDAPPAALATCDTADAACGYEAVGVASYYARMLEGRPTATGEPYDHDDLTAAHRTLPLGSLVEVTNPSNGRAIVVRVNDRGPFVRGRLIDLSGASADALDFRDDGITQVRVRYLGRAAPRV